MKRILEITTTIGCRLGCIYCPQAKLARRYRALTRRRGPRQMPWRTFERCLANVPPGVDIHFSGFSEPWLNPACTQMLLATHEAAHRVAVFTTAVGLAARDVDRIAHIPFKRFSVHLPDADGMMKSPVDDEYLRTLSALRSRSIAGLDLFSIGELHRDVRRFIGSVAETRVVNSRAGNVEPMDDRLYTIGVPPRSHNESIVCRSDRLFQNVLLPSGHVALCCMDYGLDHILGNLRSTDYETLHRRRAFLRVLRESNAGGDAILCGRCDHAVPGRYEWH